MKTLQQKRTLVTGAASGIGQCLSIALAKRGADLFLVDIDSDRLNEIAEQARSAGVRVWTDICDLSRREQIRRCAQSVRDTWGELDVLVNNAGICFYGDTVRMTEAQWDHLLRVNLHAPIQLVHEFLPILLSRPEAHIVNMASIHGLIPMGMNCAYDTSKAGLIGFSQALRAEYMRKGLGVTVACPGYVETKLFDNMECPTDGRRKVPPKWLMASPERVAERIVRAIRKNRGLVLPTALARVLYAAKRICPGFLDWLIRLRRSKRRAQVLPFPYDSDQIQPERLAS